MGSAAGARKTAAIVKAKHGVGSDGKSLHHQQAGKIGGEHNKNGYFARLAKEDPTKLAEVSRKGAEGRKKRLAADKFKYGANHAETRRPTQANRPDKAKG